MPGFPTRMATKGIIAENVYDGWTISKIFTGHQVRFRRLGAWAHSAVFTMGDKFYDFCLLPFRNGSALKGNTVDSRYLEIEGTL